MKKIIEVDDDGTEVIDAVPVKNNHNTMLWVLGIALIALIVLFYFKNRNDGKD